MAMTEAADGAELEGVNTSLTIRREGAVVVVEIAGTDFGEPGDAPFVELGRQLAKEGMNCGALSRR